MPQLAPYRSHAIDRGEIKLGSQSTIGAHQAPPDDHWALSLEPAVSYVIEWEVLYGRDNEHGRSSFAPGWLARAWAGPWFAGLRTASDRGCGRLWRPQSRAPRPSACRPFCHGERSVVGGDRADAPSRPRNRRGR